MIYRAQKKNSDEYVFGIGVDCEFLIEKICLSRDGHTIRLQDDGQYEYKAIHHHVDTTALAIHFPDMIDSKNSKIFASLSENGKGGDILIEPMFEKKQIVCKMNASGYVNKHIKASYNDYERMG